jgi:hypothetical protein
MKRALAALLACIIMSSMLWTGLRRSGRIDADSSAKRAHVDSPDGRLSSELNGVSDQIETLLEAARRGDLASYLGSFDGLLRSRLERQADERGRSAFAADLRQTAGARMSHAVFAPEPDRSSPGCAYIVVESSFADRIERQTYRLLRSDPGWRIIEVELASERLPEKKPGSLATFQEPEGVPVAADSTPRLTTVDVDLEEN